MADWKIIFGGSVTIFLWIWAFSGERQQTNKAIPKVKDHVVEIPKPNLVLYEYSGAPKDLYPYATEVKRFAGLTFDVITIEQSGKITVSFYSMLNATLRSVTLDITWDRAGKTVTQKLYYIDGNQTTTRSDTYHMEGKFTFDMNVLYLTNRYAITSNYKSNEFFLTTDGLGRQYPFDRIIVISKVKKSAMIRGLKLRTFLADIQVYYPLKWNNDHYEMFFQHVNITSLEVTCKGMYTNVASCSILLFPDSFDDEWSTIIFIVYSDTIRFNNWESPALDLQKLDTIYLDANYKTMKYTLRDGTGITNSSVSIDRSRTISSIQSRCLGICQIGIKGQGGKIGMFENHYTYNHRTDRDSKMIFSQPLSHVIFYNIRGYFFITINLWQDPLEGKIYIQQNGTTTASFKNETIVFTHPPQNPTPNISVALGTDAISIFTSDGQSQYFLSGIHPGWYQFIWIKPPMNFKIAAYSVVLQDP